MPRTQGAISASAPHPNAARLWMEHLYSDEGQLTWLGGYCHPIRFNDLVRSGKVPSRLLERLPEIRTDPSRDEPVFPTVEEQQRAKEIIRNGWDDAVGVKIPCPAAAPRPPTSRNGQPRAGSAVS